MKAGEGLDGTASGRSTLRPTWPQTHPANGYCSSSAKAFFNRRSYSEGGSDGGTATQKPSGYEP